MTEARFQAINEVTAAIKEHADSIPPIVRSAVERLLAVLVFEDIRRHDDQPEMRGPDHDQRQAG